jgi:hydrogenase maturation protein HypF
MQRRCVALRLRLHGRVQGLGVRPAVARLADGLGLAGSVRNTLEGLEVLVEGPIDAVAKFESLLVSSLPAGCNVQQCQREELRPTGRELFEIERDDSSGPLTTQLPPDNAVCEQCLAEFSDDVDRRHGYPLISCAACGPRYSAIRCMPYERSATAWGDFPPCPKCQREYTSADDRRFHAQTIACPDCGPHVWAVDGSQRIVGRRQSAVHAAVAVLRSGGIVALRGVGGYQLLCDASREDAVAELRRRKQRPSKPFAVLVSSVAAASGIASIGAVEARALRDPSNPIVVLDRLETPLTAASVSPGMNTIGVMLPATALHFQIASELRVPLICTSGNREGDPLEHEPRGAESGLAGIADLWLHHDREVENPIDDSVVRVIAGRVVTLRLGRGLGPMTLEIAGRHRAVALGGHQKGAMAWCNGQQCVLGPHVGDLETLSARRRFAAQFESAQDLYRFRAESLIHDLHPAYFSSQFARQTHLPSLSVQHHFAHVAATMLEHGLLRGPVLGVAFDGTGLGFDNTIWGGEFILADGVDSMRRIGHLQPFRLPGGEIGIREPWRVAVSVLADSVSRRELNLIRWPGIAAADIARVQTLLHRPGLNIATTSAGRLFDAAAAIILSATHSQFEGEAAMRLEAVADWSARGCYSLPVAKTEPRQLDWRGLFAAMWDDHRKGADPAVMSTKFHRALAKGIADMVRGFPGRPVVLGGGVFQNRLLTELLIDELKGSATVYHPGSIPPNDGGLAAGQLAIALARLGSVN